MEIRIVMDSLDPPAGRLQVLPGRRALPGSAGSAEIDFAGWLGLLRALYQVTGAAGSPGPGVL
jgi:hypothetical protein